MKKYILKGLGFLFISLIPWTAFAQTDTLCGKKTYATVNLLYGTTYNAFNNSYSADQTAAQPFVTPQNMINGKYKMGNGIWSAWQLPPAPPTLIASQGDYKDQIRLSWEINPLSPRPTGFVIYRNGAFLENLDEDINQYVDRFVQAGEFYQYSIAAKNAFGVGSTNKYVGFVYPNGVVSGKIETNSGNPVPGVEVRLTPLTGNAMLFNGVDGQLCVSSNPNFPTSVFTVSAYVKLGTNTNNEAGIIDLGSTLNKNFWITTLPSSEGKGYIFHIGKETGSDTLKYKIPVNNANLLGNDEKWHQITMMYNGTTMTVLVDGIFVGTKPCTMVRETKQRMTIGSKINNAFFKGLIDDVRIYDRQLTQTEINETKNRSISKNEKGLKAYWKMDEGLGTKTFDNSNSVATANMYGGVSFSADKPEVYNAGVSDVTGYYLIDGVNYSGTESFRATPMKNFEYNTALEFTAADKAHVNLTDFNIPDAATIEVLFHPFDLKSNQTILRKAGLFDLYLDNGSLLLSINGSTSTNLGLIKAKYYLLSIVLNKSLGTGKVYIDDTFKTDITFAANPFWQNGKPWVVANYDTTATANYFTGLVDEIAIFKKALTLPEIQLHSTVGIPDDSTRANLFSYFDFNENSDTKVYDYYSVNADIGQPRIGTIKNATWSNNVRRKVSVPHEFQPNVRVVNLNNSNTAIGDIDFRDVSTVSIAGTVRFQNTFCFSDSVQILVNGLPHTPAIITDKDGNWSADFEPGANVKLSPSYKDHTFTPTPYIEFRKLQAPKAGIVFLDKTKRTIRGQVAGGKCKMSIIPANQRAVVKIRTLDGCFEKTDTVRNAEGNYVFDNLPARAFSVSIVEFNHNSTIKSQFDVSGGEVVDLRDVAADTVDFVYTAPPIVEILGIADNSCAKKTIGQGVQNQITVKVYEDYFGAKCYVDGANIKINDPSTGILTDTTLAAGVKDFIYKFTPKNVNIIPPYETTLTATATVNSSTDTKTTKFIVLGMKEKGNTFTSSTPETPLFVLRDPPGDASYATLERGSSYCYSTSRTVTDVFSQEASLAVSIGGTTSIGIGSEIETTNKATLSVSGGANEVWTNATNRTNCIATTKVISTSANDQVIGSRAGGDVYVGITENVTYGTADELNLNFTTCNYTLTPRLTINDVRMKSDFVYSEYHIINDVIPSLELLGSQTIAVNPNRKADSIAAVMWKKYVDQNKADRGNLIKSISFDAGAVYDETISTETGNGWSESFDGGGFLAAGASVELDFLGGFEAGLELRYEHNTSNASDNQFANNVVINYHLEDDDSGDNFFVNIHKANRWTESYIFGIVAGESSCPWEYGTLPRSEPSILSVDGTSKVNIHFVNPSKPALADRQIG